MSVLVSFRSDARILKNLVVTLIDEKGNKKRVNGFDALILLDKVDEPNYPSESFALPEWD